MESEKTLVVAEPTPGRKSTIQHYTEEVSKKKNEKERSQSPAEKRAPRGKAKGAGEAKVAPPKTPGGGSGRKLDICKFANDHGKCKYGIACMKLHGPQTDSKPAEEAKPEGKPAAGAPKAGGKQGAPAKPAEQQKFADIRKFAESRQLRVQDEGAFEFYKSRYADQVIHDPAAKFNPHEYSAVARDLCVTEVLKIEGKDLKKMQVLDYYGSPRNLSLLPKACGVSVEWTCGPNTKIKGDSSRNARWLRKDVPPGQMFDTVMVQDVYQEGDGPYSALSPASILSLVAMTRSGNVYVMVRVFVGEAGCDDYGDGRREQVWYRKDGLVISSPEQGVPPYPAHPDVNWLLKRHVDGLDISVLKQVGPYHLFRCSAAAPDAQEIGMEIEIEPAVSLIRIACARSWGQKLYDGTVRPVVEKFQAALPQFMQWEESAPPVFLVNVRVAAVTGDKFMLKPPYGTIVDAAGIAVDAAMAKDHLCICLRERFPSFFGRMRLDTTMACVYAKREHISARLFSLRTDFVPSEKELALARGSTMPFEARGLPISPKTMVMGLGAIAGILVLRYSLRHAASGSFSTVVANAVAKYPPLRRPLEFLGGGLPLEVWLDYPAIALRNRASVLFAKSAQLLFLTIPRSISSLRDVVAGVCTEIIENTVDFLRGGFYHATLVRWSREIDLRPFAVIHELAVPFYEELLYKCFPRFTNCIFAMEFLGHWTLVGLWPALCTASLHRGCAYLQNHFTAKGKPGFGYLAAATAHFLWNMRATPIAPGGGFDLPKSTQPRPTYVVPQGSFIGLFDSFVNAYIQGERVEPRSSWCAIPAATTLPGFRSKVTCGPEHFRGTVAIRIDGREVSMEEAFVVLSDPEPEKGTADHGRNVLHPILVTNGLLWMPAKTPLNTMVACLHRIHNDPFTKCDPPHIIEERWRETAKMMIESGMFSGIIHEVKSLVQCCIDMGPKGRRIFAAYQADISGAKDKPHQMAIFVKWNETITAQKLFHNGQVTMKPRAIVNLDPIIHANMAQLSRALNGFLHQIFVQSNVWKVGAKSMIIVYASGSDQNALNAAGAALFRGEADCVVIVSGDDSAYNWFGQLGEADQSAFDHTQSTGAINVAAVMWMEALGVPPEFINLLLFCSRIRYKIKYERLEMTGEAGTQLPTGFMCTTSLSSVDCIFMYVRWLARIQVRPTIALAEVGEELGFTVKDQRRDDPHQVTFLKGWWAVHKVTRDPLWMPLPSAVLKLGKVLRPPREIAYVVTNGKRVQPPMEVAIAQVAYAIAMSYGNVSDDYPILGSFLKKLRRLGVARAGGQVHRTIGFNAVWESNWYKTRVDVGLIDSKITIQAVCERYGFTPDDLFRVEELIGKVNTLPAYIEDPVFDRLVEVDYQ